MRRVLIMLLFATHLYNEEHGELLKILLLFVSFFLLLFCCRKIICLPFLSSYFFCSADNIIESVKKCLCHWMRKDDNSLEYV